MISYLLSFVMCVLTATSVYGSSILNDIKVDETLVFVAIASSFISIGCVIVNIGVLGLVLSMKVGNFVQTDQHYAREDIKYEENDAKCQDADEADEDYEDADEDDDDDADEDDEEEDDDDDDADEDDDEEEDDEAEIEQEYGDKNKKAN